MDQKSVNAYKDISYCFILVLLVVIAYFGTIGNGFVNMDDPLQLTGQSHVLSGITWDNFLFSFGPESWCGPLTWLGYAAGHAFFGLNPAAFHMMSLILHAANSVLLFYLFRRMTGAYWQSVFVALLFALHPINVESVAWVAELNNVLSGLFFMLTLLAYCFYTDRPDGKRYILTLVMFALGLLAKPVLMTLPFVLLLLDLWPLKRIGFARADEKDGGRTVLQGAPVTRLVMEKVPFLALSLISFLINLHGANVKMGLYSSESVPLDLRLSNAVVSTVKYLGKLFWPQDLAIFYPYPTMIPVWQTAGAVLLIVLITAAALRVIARHPYYIVGWLWFLGSLAPFLGVFQAGVWPEMADRYAYLPFIGIFAALSWGVSELSARWKNGRQVAAAAGILAIPILMALTWSQTGYWKNSETLFTHALDVTKNNYMAHNCLGLAFSEKGDLEGAIREYRQSIAIKPYFLDPRNNLGIALFNMRRYGEAEEQFRECLKIHSQKGDVYNNLGGVMLATGNYDAAIEYYLEALRLNPYQEGVYYNIGNAYLQKGNTRKAVEHYKRAVDLRPDFPDAVNSLRQAAAAQKNTEQLISRIRQALASDPANPLLLTRLGDILRQQSEYDQAIAQYEKALSARANDINAYNGLVLTYSEKKDYANAVDVLLRMKRLQPDNPDVYYNLACIYAKQSMPDDAVGWLKQSIDKGFRNWDLLKKDPDLESIRNTSFVNDLMNQ